MGLAKNAEALLKRVRKWDTEFLCLGGAKVEAWSVPKVDELLPRVTANLDYFSVNYGICLALFSLIAIVIYPQLLVLVCVFSGLWYGLATRPAHLKIPVGANSLTKRHLTYGLSVLNALVVFMFARKTIFETIGASFLFVLVHASLHSIPSKAKGKLGEDEATVPMV